MVDHKGNEIKKGRRGGRECIGFDGEQGKNALALGREGRRKCLKASLLLSAEE